MEAITTWSCIKFDPYEMNTKKFRYALGHLRIGERLKVCCGLARKKRSISVPNFRNIHCSLSTSGTSSKDKPYNLVPLTLSVLWNNVKTWSRLHHVVATGILASCILVIPSAQAADAVKTYNCLLKECRIELEKCMANPTCAANIACVEICSTRPDEKECQMKCGDMFQNSVIDEFNACAISRKKCVPNKPNTGEFPVPDPEALVKSFNLSDFTGKWYISSGLNPIFDIFDCQAHEFKLEGNRLVGNMTWRIRMPDTGFITRSTVQKFVQDPSRPGILYNHDNEYLHYQDEWYIISTKIENKPSDYVFVYYRGRNDAWDGYGGAVIYTRSSTLPTTIIPELDHAAKSINHEFSKFTLTDNTCGPQPLLAERIKWAEEVVIRSVTQEVERIERIALRLAKTELKLFQRLAEVFLIGGERC